jgi:16S rRNA (guanine966-N2)-methyltransferase
MRIIGGTLKGRVLTSPASDQIRPTSDRLRESIFNVLAHNYPAHLDGTAVIDLFAGTGAMGIEALSRGARRALFVDDGSEARALIRANVDALALGGQTRVFRRDARKLGLAPVGERFDLAFLDPPYGKAMAGLALIALHEGGWLVADALIVVEEAAAAPIDLPQGYEEIETRTYGDTHIIFARVKQPA